MTGNETFPPDELSVRASRAPARKAWRLTYVNSPSHAADDLRDAVCPWSGSNHCIVRKTIRNVASRSAFSASLSLWTGVMRDRPPTGITRREALRTAAAASTFAVPVTVLAVTYAHAYDPGNEEGRSRYRETDHVRAFYRVNGYETLAQ
jgi:hypothetical protein